MNLSPNLIFLYDLVHLHTLSHKHILHNDVFLPHLDRQVNYCTEDHNDVVFTSHNSYSLNYYSISSNIQFIQDITVDALRLYVCSESILYNFALFIISTTSPFVGTLPLSKYSFKVF